MPNSKISSKKPRETAGRDTILRFDYQFRRTAEASLQLLENGNLERVFCDLHDDYVLKIWENEKALFLFHQVKTKKKDGDRWEQKEIFGTSVKSKAKNGAAKDSIAGKLFFHHLEFGENCKSVHIVTNAHFKDEIEEITKLISTSKKTDEAEKDKQTKKILDSFAADFSSTTDVVYEFLKKLELKANAGKLTDIQSDEHGLYLKRIYDYSEVSLDQSQAKKIAEALLTLVKQKSMQEIPASVTERDLEKYSSVELSDVLKILSISEAAYLELKNGGDLKALKTVSVLQRLLKRSKANEDMIISACKAKVQWDNWIREYRHAITHTDFLTLQTSAQQSLNQYANSEITLAELGKQIESISAQFQGKLQAGITLNPDLIFGLIWSIAVTMEIF